MQIVELGSCTFSCTVPHILFIQVFADCHFDLRRQHVDVNIFRPTSAVHVNGLRDELMTHGMWVPIRTEWTGATRREPDNVTGLTGPLQTGADRWISTI